MKSTKMFLLLLFLCLGLNSLSAQLENTVWKGTFMVPVSLDCVLEFKTDTVNLKYAEGFVLNENSDKEVLEKMAYKIDKNTVTFRKTSGGSPCSVEDLGVYNFSVKDNTLLLTLVKDDCAERSMSFPETALSSVK